MRTDEQIVEKVKAENDRNMFVDFSGDLLLTLPFDVAKPFLRDGVTRDEWGPPLDRSPPAVIKRITEYMPFAWDKANNGRGLSALRSIDHMRAWLWLLGEEEASSAIRNYDSYGKPQLAAICEHFGIDWRSLDDGVWSDDETGKRRIAPLIWKQKEAAE